MHTRLVSLAAAAWLAVASCLFVGANERQPRAYVAVSSVYKRDASRALTTYGVTRADLRSLSQTFSDVVALRAIVARARRADAESDSVVIGCTPNLAEVAGIEVSSGRFLTRNDSARAENVCVVSEALAQRLFPNVNPIGRNVRLQRGYFLVVGVCKPPGRPIGETHLRTQQARIDHKAVMFLPLNVMRARMGDTHLMRKAGSFEGHQFELSEIWAPAPETVVMAILRNNREPGDPMEDLLIAPRNISEGN